MQDYVISVDSLQHDSQALTLIPKRTKQWDKLFNYKFRAKVDKNTNKFLIFSV